MKKLIFILLMTTVVMVGFIGSCKKIAIKETTTSAVNIYQYLQLDSLQRFTSLLTVINKTGYDAFLSAYGTYTLFAPTNDAIASYLKKTGKSSLDQITVGDLKNLLMFHLLQEEIYTTDFNDGKLPSITMYGQFLVTSIGLKYGVSYYIVNRQADILQANILTGNGVIQVLDSVLIPTTQSVAQIVGQNTDYSIFTQAMKETGFYDSLNLSKNPDSTQRWFTLLAETDKDMNDSGILTYAALKAKYSNTGNPKDPKDSLNLFVAYHILPDIQYLADIVVSSSHSTMAPLQVVTDKVVNNQVLINDDIYSTLTGTVHEQGIQLDLATSDVSAMNGVVHHALAHFGIKVRAPFPVYWDLCATQPELTRLTSTYKHNTYLFDYGDSTNNTFKGIKWEKSCLKYRAGVTGYLGDYWEMGLGTSSSNTSSLGTCAGNSWIEFVTPLLVAGRYNVWFCYYAQNSTVSAVQASFDGVPLTSALIQFNQKISSVDPAQESALQAIGWKWWAGTAKKSGSTVGRMLGIVNITQTGNHKIRFTLVSGSNSDCNFDMVHFIPVGMNQVSPRFNPDGTIEY